MLLVASCHAGALPAELWPQIVVIAVISISLYENTQEYTLYFTV